MDELSNRHFLIVGATGALGSRIARELSRQGAELTLSGRNEEKLGVLAADLGGAATVRADISTPAGPAAITQAVSGRPLHGIVYAAGVVAFGPLTELDDDTLDELLLTNVVGYIRLLRAVAPHLERDSLIVQLSAVVAESPTAGMAAYSASKAALSAFAKAAALELRRQGVRILDVRPPHTETGLTGRSIAGSAPKLAEGKDADAVARRIVQAMIDGERDLPSSSFA
ncbi:SDR family NAD(P)-dependent oxidoreductase [Arthrobacter sp. H5]|uniref:SDR family NAD(P)-dependent oxidoreductase n=1 Tax=Arthrobacter sp. H5 TaxID=1267973 RepID=UPI000488E959|nr:SDR family NAD(P)-dependent oxidoreductase [Arthrobacter sp. H5]